MNNKIKKKNDVILYAVLYLFVFVCVSEWLTV